MRFHRGMVRPVSLTRQDVAGHGSTPPDLAGWMVTRPFHVQNSKMAVLADNPWPKEYRGVIT